MACSLRGRPASRALALIGFAVLLTGCGSAGTSSGSSNSMPYDRQLHDSLPADVRSSGVVKVGTAAAYPPFESVDPATKQIVGVDPDLMKAVGGVLGVRFALSNVGFATLIPSLQSGRFHIAWSDAGDTKEREKVVDVIDYGKTITKFLVKKGGSVRINGFTDVCGHRVAVEQGTSGQQFMTKQNTDCTTAGKKGVTVQPYSDMNAAVLAVQSGRADAAIANASTLGWLVKQSSGQFETMGPTYQNIRTGILLPKNSELSQPILKALQKLQASGDYHKIFAKWGVADAELDKVTVNGALS